MRRFGRRLSRGSATTEDGFSLVEVTVALAIFALVMIMMSGMMAAGMRGVLRGKQRQVATQEANMVMEVARSLSYDNIGLVSTDPTLATDTSIQTVDGRKQYLVDAGANRWEPVVWASNTASHPFNPHTTTLDRGSTTLTRSVYVTAVDENGDGLIEYRRVLVDVEWEAKGTHGADNHVVAQTLVSESGLLPVGGAPGAGCPPGASACITGLTPMIASTTSNGGSLTIQSASGDLAALLNADLENAPKVGADLARTSGETQVRGVEWVNCSVHSTGLNGSDGVRHGYYGSTVTADTDPAGGDPSSNSYSRSASLTDPVSGGDAVDRFLVETALGSQLDCAVEARHSSDGLPYGTGTATGPSSLNFTQDITGAGLASNLLTLASMGSTSSTQELDHRAVSGAREIVSTARGSVGATQILRIPGTLEHGLVQLSPFNYTASAVTSEGTPSAAPSVTSSGGIEARLYDPAGIIVGCDSRSGEYCVKTIPVGGAAGASGFSTSVQGSVLRNSGLTILTFDYSINAFPPSVSPSSGTIGPNGETRWNADYTAVSISARLKIDVIVDSLTGLTVTLADSRVVGTMGLVSAAGCAGVSCA